ncbi:FlhC family transcriptional regulator [Janthinobacterium sp. 64]|uniref:FlhC family transcriptional regulator n=1 Tax=Janthinobacterium sp. 64 TaxID=2035208 RepID=UPI000C2BA79B|nr:FlhC family transcriptional regulator [Janthinobacterium sp. 64]PKB13857.1 transcriptional activator FlhC [Janthinobacterium sp. 64]
MGHIQVNRHINAFILADTCAQLGATIGTASCVSGLSMTVLRRLLYDQSGERRGRGIASAIFWYERTNNMAKADACMFAAIFMQVCELNDFGASYTPGNALIDSFKLYSERCRRDPYVSIDRAFLLACHLKGIWTQRSPSLLLKTCRHCTSQYIVHRKNVMSCNNPCVFCHLVKAYATDPRIRRHFPQPVPPNALQAQQPDLAAEYALRRTGHA